MNSVFVKIASEIIADIIAQKLLNKFEVELPQNISDNDLIWH